MEKCLNCGQEFEGESCPNCQTVDNNVNEELEVSLEDAEPAVETPVEAPAKTTKKEKTPMNMDKITTILLGLGVVAFLLAAISFTVYYFSEFMQAYTPDNIGVMISNTFTFISAGTIASAIKSVSSLLPMLSIVTSALVYVTVLVALVAIVVCFILACKGDLVGKKTASFVFGVILFILGILAFFTFLSEIGVLLGLKLYN